MDSSDRFAARRAANWRSLEAFGARPTDPGKPLTRPVHDGSDQEIFTIGYERRTLNDLVRTLVDLDIQVLIDVRGTPTSRRADFRGERLGQACQQAGVRYEGWTELGSTKAQRDELHATGDLYSFKRRFRDFVRRRRRSELAQLARLALNERLVLLCYEREHESCHRSVVAELLHQAVGVTVVAIS